MREETFKTNIGGKTFSATFTDLTEQANGSVIVRYGNTTVLVTAVMGSAESDKGYFPLSVEYEEKFYAAGAILGSRFIRREGRPSDDAVLSARVVDRTVRPLFDHALRKDVQVVVTVLSIDEDDPDVLAVNAASLALSTSDIPWEGPVSAVRVGKKRGSDAFIVNPTYAERDAPDTELDLLLCGKDGTVTMIEVGANEISEETLAQAFAFGLAELEKLQRFQKEIIGTAAKEKQLFEKPETPEAVVAYFEALGSRFEQAVFSGRPGKGATAPLKDEYLGAVAEEHPEHVRAADEYFESQVEALMRERAIRAGERVDGRALDEVRPLFAKAGGVSPVLHGSGIFYRGGTHIFSALTLGGPEDSQIIDSIEGAEEKKRFMHHYNFPPFSVGETGRIGGFNRRMIGHGALAEKALVPVIPPQDAFPYTIRIVSEALASNGSTSMGSVCASSLALMDGGVPIAAPVAGIAMGVMYESPERYAVLTDIQGPEDHHGDMDFKVAGTEKGVTAIQLDVKVEGVPPSILAEALQAAKKARLHILETMKQAIAAPRADLNPRAPKIITLSIPPDMIGLVIGGSGKTVKKIQEDTGVDSISIEDDGRVFITGRADTPEAAETIIRDMTRVFTPGETVEGKVTRLADFGAFVRLNSRIEGLVHISEVAPFRIDRMEDALTVGETVKVVVKDSDGEGRVSLSIKAADPDFAARKGLKPPTRPTNRNGNRKNRP
ncbi:MAG: polyribonucleotide nucleotidyltransferase [Candidatus Paceibacteria bacterium]